MILDWIVFIMLASLVIVGAIIFIGFLLKLVYYFQMDNTFIVWHR